MFFFMVPFNSFSWKFEKQLHFLVLAQMTTTSTSHLHFFLFASSLPLHLLQLPSPHAHTNHYHHPPQKNHPLSLEAQWAEPNTRKIFRLDVRSPEGGDSYLPSSNLLYHLQNVLHNVAGLLKMQPQPVLGKFPLSYIWLHLCLFGRGMGSRWDSTSPSYLKASQHLQSLFAHPVACEVIFTIPARDLTISYRQKKPKPRGSK